MNCGFEDLTVLEECIENHIKRVARSTCSVECLRMAGDVKMSEVIGREPPVRELIVVMEVETIKDVPITVAGAIKVTEPIKDDRSNAQVNQETQVNHGKQVNQEAQSNQGAQVNQKMTRPLKREPD